MDCHGPTRPLHIPVCRRSFGDRGVIEGFEKTPRHGIAHGLVVPPDEERLIKGFVIENPGGEPRGYDVCFQAPILVCEIREFRQLFY